jgi:outer membrane protein TolC
VIAGLPTLSAGYNYIGQGHKCLGINHLMGFWTDFIYRQIEIPIFSGFETRSKVRQADIQLRTMKEDLIDTKLSLDLAYANKTQINNSIIHQNQKKTHN